jgi:hypothetical protein
MSGKTTVMWAKLALHYRTNDEQEIMIEDKHYIKWQSEAYTS